ncbi:MAG TPA: PDZ domain-containing protein, partial [Trueperaceae bacterium]|nr:PDZ domain-containing protein [Trueperaceae bacterium]
MKPKILIAAVAVLAVSFFVVSAQRGFNFTEEFLANPSGNALTQVYGNLKHEYLNDVDDEKLTQGAIKGMIEALDDPFTYYVTPEDAVMRNEDQSGSFEGIGALLQILNQQTGKGVKIVNVYKDGPAWKAGIHPGDIFHKVDDTIVDDMTPTEVARIVRGPEGTNVYIEMIR